MDITPFISPAVTIVLAVVAAYAATKDNNGKQFAALTVQIAKLSTQVDDLRNDVDKHNNVVERTAMLERDTKTAFARIDELKEKDEKLEQKIERLHDGK